MYSAGFDEDECKRDHADDSLTITNFRRKKPLVLKAASSNSNRLVSVFRNKNVKWRRMGCYRREREREICTS